MQYTTCIDKLLFCFICELNSTCGAAMSTDYIFIKLWSIYVILLSVTTYLLKLSSDMITKLTLVHQGMRHLYEC